jgi:hypothetical protein
MVRHLLPRHGHGRQDKNGEGMWNILSHVLPPCGGGYRWGVSLGVPPILTFPREGGREITPLPVLVSAYPGAYARHGGGGRWMGGHPATKSLLTPQIASIIVVLA